MFKWGRSSKHEPKTPRLTSVALPDERYTPVSYPYAYPEAPRSNTFMRRFTLDRRATTPMLDAWKPPHESSRARSRTMSTPVRDVQAPSPIRPHPSQGPFIPVLERGDRIRIEHSRNPLAPVGVPSAEYLEEQVYRNRMSLTRAPTAPILKKTPSRTHRDEQSERRNTQSRNSVTTTHSRAYIEERAAKKNAELAPIRCEAQTRTMIDELRDRGFSEEKIAKLEIVPSKAWIEEQAERKEEEAAAKAKEEEQAKAAAERTARRARPLKSALKKSTDFGAPRDYSSENESARPRTGYPTPRGPASHSRVFQEEQIESAEQLQSRGWASQATAAAARNIAPQVHAFPASTFGHTSSTSTGSPSEESVLNHQRSRRSRSDSMPRSNYMPAYIRETRVAPAVQPTTPAWLAVPEHCMLQWPLIEFAARKREGEPPVYFDAGFDPRQDKYAPRAKRGAYSTPLTREECTMCISSSAYIPEIIIISRKLEMWPVHIRGNRNLRVIDIFRQIYDTYSRQLTQEELMRWGPEYIARCERAFKQRCEDGPALTVHAERHGMLRIDLLRGRRIFKGLVPIRGKPMHYELLFED